jgi:hypothetical protein
MLNEAFAALFGVLPWHLSDNEKNHETPHVREDSQSSDRD